MFKTLAFAVVISAGCDLVQQASSACQKIADQERAQIEADVLNVATTACKAVVDRAVTDSLTAAGCSQPDGGVWSCAGTWLCR